MGGAAGWSSDARARRGVEGEVTFLRGSCRFGPHREQVQCTHAGFPRDRASMHIWDDTGDSPGGPVSARHRSSAGEENSKGLKPMLAVPSKVGGSKEAKRGW